jgi:hypothetical protein
MLLFLFVRDTHTELKGPQLLDRSDHENKILFCYKSQLVTRHVLVAVACVTPPHPNYNNLNILR